MPIANTVSDGPVLTLYASCDKCRFIKLFTFAGKSDKARRMSLNQAKVKARNEHQKTGCYAELSFSK